jgi:omega-amidase
MKNLNITIVQTNLHWENPTANLAMLEELLWDLQGKTDLIVLPEMFTTGFSMNTTLAEHPQLHTFRWLQQQAQHTKAVVCGSYIVKENNKFYNRLLWMEPNGQWDYYDKKHLFRMAGEDKYFTAGTKKLIKNLHGWRISPFICYDLRFPLWSYNLKNSNIQYDCLIYTANFPEPRAIVWNTLLKARAIENWAYCVGVNRIGTDGLGIHYAGDSAVISPKGNTIFEAKDQPCVQTITLDWQELQDYRTKFPAYLDADTNL